MGYPRASLTFVRTDNGSRPQLKYFEGNVCPQDKQTKLSSQIEFYCDPAAGKVFSLCSQCIFRILILKRNEFCVQYVEISAL